MEAGSSITFPTYLVPLGDADIFFPTDFGFLLHMYKHVCGRDAIVYPHAAFLAKYAAINECRTQSGFNPMLSDYSNMRVFTSL